MPATMVASSEHCRRHVSGSASTVCSFSDDGVVQSVLKEIKRAGVMRQRTGTKAPLVSISHLRRAHALVMATRRRGCSFVPVAKARVFPCTVSCLLFLLLRAGVVCRRQSFLFSAMLSSTGVFFVVLASISTGGLAADRSVKCIRSSVERPHQLLACGARGVDAGLFRRTNLFDAE